MTKSICSSSFSLVIAGLTRNPGFSGRNKNIIMKQEKQSKHWKRKWTIQLIEKNNPVWLDLSDEV